MLRFTLLRQGRPERSLTLLKDDVVIGRLPDIDIALSTPTVSRQHARIHPEGGGYVLEDLGSINGVSVGGRRVSRHLLSPGDSITIEDYTIVFEPSEELYEQGLHSESKDPRASRNMNITFMNIGQFAAKDADAKPTGAKDADPEADPPKGAPKA